MVRAAFVGFGRVETKIESLRRIYACGEFFAHLGQRGLGIARVRMRGAEDPPPPLDHVLQDALGFKQVVACVGIENGSSAPHGS